MKMFEYSEHVLDRDHMRQALNYYGAEGWELVAVEPSKRTEHDKDIDHRWAKWVKGYFKRELGQT
jgi:hypothetical protein